MDVIVKEVRTMNRQLRKMIVGTLGSAALMYLMDPEKGDERRAALRDQFTKFMNTATQKTEAVIEQISDRAQGVAAETKRKLSTEEVSDEVMVARVRSAMGHVLTNAHEVEVLANQGLITLTGSVPSAETDTLINTIKALPGVHGVENRLEAYEGTTDLS
jgi:osmotically-inducible protein OsmY